MIQTAVLGYGTVGSGVVKVIETNHDSIEKKAGVDLGVKYVLDLRDFPGDPVQKKIVHDFDVILSDPRQWEVWSRLIHLQRKPLKLEKVCVLPIKSW